MQKAASAPQLPPIDQRTCGAQGRGAAKASASKGPKGPGGQRLLCPLVKEDTLNRYDQPTVPGDTVDNDGSKLPMLSADSDMEQTMRLFRSYCPLGFDRVAKKVVGLERENAYLRSETMRLWKVENQTSMEDTYKQVLQRIENIEQKVGNVGEMCDAAVALVPSTVRREVEKKFSDAKKKHRDIHPPIPPESGVVADSGSTQAACSQAALPSRSENLDFRAIELSSTLNKRAQDLSDGQKQLTLHLAALEGVVEKERSTAKQLHFRASEMIEGLKQDVAKGLMNTKESFAKTLESLDLRLLGVQGVGRDIRRSLDEHVRQTDLRCDAHKLEVEKAVEQCSAEVGKALLQIRQQEKQAERDTKMLKDNISSAAAEVERRFESDLSQLRASILAQDNQIVDLKNQMASTEISIIKGQRYMDFEKDVRMQLETLQKAVRIAVGLVQNKLENAGAPTDQCNSSTAEASLLENIQEVMKAESKDSVAPEILEKIENLDKEAREKIEKLDKDTQGCFDEMQADFEDMEGKLWKVEERVAVQAALRKDDMEALNKRKDDMEALQGDIRAAESSLKVLLADFGRLSGTLHRVEDNLSTLESTTLAEQSRSSMFEANITEVKEIADETKNRIQGFEQQLEEIKDALRKDMPGGPPPTSEQWRIKNDSKDREDLVP